MKLVLAAAAAVLLLVPVVLVGVAVGALGGAEDPTRLVAVRGAPGLAVAAVQAGFSGQGLRLAVAVGLAESRAATPPPRNPNPPTPGCPTGSTDRGAWQLNTCYHPEVADACADDQALATLAALSRDAGVLPGFGTPGPCGLSPAADYAKHLVTWLFGIADIGGCALFSGHIENSDHYPEKRESSGLLKVLAR